jgi:hypothetical protein
MNSGELATISSIVASEAPLARSANEVFNPVGSAGLESSCM